VTENVVDDAELIDDAALGAAEERMGAIAGDRPEPHRSALAQLGTEGGRIHVRLSLAVHVADPDAKSAGEPEQAGRIALECPVRPADGISRPRRRPSEPVDHALGELGSQVAPRPQQVRGEKAVARMAIDLELRLAPRREQLVRRRRDGLGDRHAASLLVRSHDRLRACPAPGPWSSPMRMGVRDPWGATRASAGDGSGRERVAAEAILAASWRSQFATVASSRSQRPPEVPMSADHRYMFPRVREMTAEERAAQARLVRRAVSAIPAAPRARVAPLLRRDGVTG
jgi:hypothetical protein